MELALHRISDILSNAINTTVWPLLLQ